MTLKYMLDTNIVIYTIKNKAAEVDEAFKPHDGQVCMSSVILLVNENPLLPLGGPDVKIIHTSHNSVGTDTRETPHEKNYRSPIVYSVRWADPT